MELEALAAVLAAVAGMIAGIEIALRPMLSLNRSITELTATLRHIQERSESQDERIHAHGVQIDALERTATAHEVRITHLEGNRHG